MHGVWILGLFFVAVGWGYAYLSGRTWLHSRRASNLFYLIGMSAVLFGGMIIGLNIYPPPPPPLITLFLMCAAIGICELLAYGSFWLGKRGSPLVSQIYN